MLEKVDLNKSVDKENYKKLREEMDVKLGELQRACKAEKIPVVIVFDGFGAGGKGTQSRWIRAVLMFMRAGRRGKRNGCVHFSGGIGRRHRKMDE
mgnify:CR=1 FL=1